MNLDRLTTPRLVQLFVLLAFVALFAGCASTDEVVLDATKRPVTTTVDIFKDGNVPTRPFKEIAELSFLGPREEEFKALRHFVAEAKKKGASAVIMQPVILAGQKGGGAFGPSGGAFGSSTAWVFKAKAVVYDDKK